MMESVIVSRPAFSEERFHDTYADESFVEATSLFSRFSRWRRSSCSPVRFWKFLLKFFPVLYWLPKYERRYIAGDLVAGWTVGIIRIPQGMAYALLAGVQPVYGLYSCFFPVLLWFVFSTSRHTSVGTMAVVCLMIQNLISLHVPDVEISYKGSIMIVNGQDVDINSVPKQFIDETGDESLPSMNSSSYALYLHEENETKKIQIACSATLLVGVMQLAMAILRLGFLTTLLSDPVIQGFTTGAAFHVMTSQVKYIFGLDKSIGKHSGPLALFKIYGDIFSNLSHANVADIVISSIALPSLFIVKYLNQKYKKKLKNIPVPVELILVVIATLASYFGKLDASPFDVNTVKTIPTGFPSLSAPPYVSLWPTMVTDCLIMAFISVAISLSLTKIYSDKHGYEVDANQEILALGICNTLPAFLSSFAVAASLSRTAIQESTGGKTQVVGILSSVLMLVVLLWLAPLFQPVPKSVLACIIIVALKNLFLQFGNLKQVWSISKFDFLIWIATCGAVVVLGVDLGLAVGVAMAIAGLLYQIQHPKHFVLGRIGHTDLYADLKRYKDASEIDRVKIFHFADSVSFTNKDAFRRALYGAVGCNPTVALSKARKNQKLGRDSEINQLLLSEEYATTTLSPKRKKSFENVRKRGTTSHEASIDVAPLTVLGFNILILDATMWSFVDWTGSREVMQIIDKFNALGVIVLMAGLSQNVLQTLDGCGLTSRVTHEQVFVTVHDAAVRAEQINRERTNQNDSDDSFSDMPGYPGYDSLAF